MTCRSLLIYSLFFFLVACAPAPTEQASPLEPTKAESEAVTPTRTETAKLAIALTKQAPLGSLNKETCLTAGGHIEQLTLESEFLDKPLSYRVYTPPCYYEHTDQRYPVLYLIHGQTYNEDQWDRLGADEAADALIAAGNMPPFLIVMPADASHYTQPAANGFDEAVIEELIPWVDKSYRTLPDRAFRAVGGLSRGASWAIHLALTHADLFGALGGHSPPVFQEDASKMRGWLDAFDAARLPRMWLDIGAGDQEAILSSAIWFEALLNERSLPHEWHLFPGNHSEEYWSSHVELYLRWYAGDW
jgi:enterochelin esterase-like enzyme